MAMLPRKLFDTIIPSSVAYLIVQISTQTGQVINYDIYSEISPTCYSTITQTVVDKAEGVDYEEAKNNLIAKMNNKLNPPFLPVTPVHYTKNINYKAISY